MSKKCKVDNCNSDVFGKGYCRKHQYLRDDIVKGIKKLQKRIKPMSDKRKEQNDIYLSIKEDMLHKAKIDGNYRCFFCGKPFDKDYIPDIHHLIGRKEDDLTDRDYLVLVHRECHTEYHSYTVKQLMNTSWYNNFLNKIEVMYPDVYSKELNKQLKA